MRRTLLSLVVMVLCTLLPLNAEIHYEMNPVSFEEGSIPAGWSADTLWMVEGGASVTLDYPNGCADGVYRAAARYASGTFGSKSAKLVTPAMNLTESSAPLLVFSYAAPAFEGVADTLVVSYRANATDSWHQLKSLTRVAAWSEVEIELPNYISGSAYQVQFEMVHADNSVKGVSLDNIFIYKSPMCEAPSFSTFDVWQDSLYVEMNGVPGGGISALYEVILSAVAINPDTVTDFTPYFYHEASMVENFVELGGLEAFKKYYFYARTNCDDNRTGYTQWAAREFRAPMLIDLPHVENFNADLKLPAGWQVGCSEGLTNVPAVIKSNYYSVDSTNCLFFGASATSTTSSIAALSAGQYVYAVMPQFRDVDVKQVQISFWGSAYTFVGDLYAPHLEVGVMSDPDDFGTFAKVEDLVLESQYQFKKYVVNFASYVGDGRYLAFVVRGADVKNLYAIDNIQVSQNTNVIPVPAQPVLKAIAPTSLTLEVNLHGADSWNLLVGESYVHDGVPAAYLSQNGISGNTYTVALSDTLANHILTVYAQGVKGGVAGEWSFPLTVRVPAQIADTLPWNIGFTSATPTLLLKSLNNELHTASTIKAPASVYFFPNLISNSAPSIASNKLKIANGTYAALGYASSYNNREVTFYLNGGSTSTLTKVALGMMTNPYDAATFVELARFEGELSSSEYARCIYDFDNYDDAAHYLAFKVLEGTAYVQSIDITTIPTCREVSIVNLQLQGAKTANFSWNANNMTEWQVVLATNKAMTDTVANEIVTAPNCTISDLLPRTTYYYKVNTICGSDTVQMYGTHSFTTPFGLPLVEDFESLTAGIPTGWDNSEGTASSDYRWAYNTEGNPGKCVRYNSYSAPSGATNYLKTPVLAIGDENVRLTFDYMNPKGGAFAVYYTVNDGARIQLDSLGQVATWKTYTYVLPDSVKNKQVQFHFLGVSNYGYGDAYHYLDNIKVASFDPNCQGVSALAARAIDESSVQVTWQAGGTQSIQLSYFVQGDTTAAPVVVENITTSPYTISGLVSNTTYVIEAVQSCNLQGDTVSTEVHTMCGTFTPAAFGVETFTSKENIECWMFGLDTVGTNMSATTYASSLPAVATKVGFGKVLSFNKQKNTTSYKYGNDYYAILPQFDVDSISKYQLVFDAAAPTTGLADNVRTLAIGVSMNQSVAMTGIDTIVIAPAADSTLMSHYVIPFDSYQGDRFGRQGKYIVLKVSSDENHSNQIYIDNVSLEPLSTCKQITSVECTEANSNNATIEWENTNAAAYDLLVVDTLYTKIHNYSADHVVYHQVVTSNSAVVDELASNTNYYAYVRAICAEGDTAIWSNTLSFQTAIGVPYLETFDDFASTYPSNGWKGYRGSSLKGNSINIASLTENNSMSTGWYVSNNSDEIGSTMAGKAVRTEIFSTGYNAMLTSPEIVLPEAEEGFGYRVSFRIARKPWSSSTSTMANATDHFFKVMVSVNDSIYERVTSWEVGKGDYAYNDINMAGIVGKADLSAYAGQHIRLGFMTGTESNSSPDTYFSIDSVSVDLYSTACGGVSGLDVKLDSAMNAVATWNVTGAPEKSIVEFSIDPTFATQTISDTVTVRKVTFTSLKYNTTYYVRVKQGDCVDATWSVGSVTTPLAVPYAEEWESTTLPSNWSRLTGDIFSNKATSTTSGWYLTTSAGGGMNTTHAYYNAYHYYSSYSDTHTYYKYSLVTPELVMLNEPGNNIKLSFDLALTTGSSNSTAPAPAACAGHTFAVLVSVDGGKTWNTDSTLILTGADYQAIPATATSYEFDLTAFAGEKAMVAFYHGVDSTAPAVSSGTTYINLDKIKLQSVNLSCLAPQLVVAGAGLDSLEIALDGAAAQYEIEYATNAAFVDAQSLTVAADTAVITGLTHSTIYYVRARALCGATQSSWSDAIQAMTACAPVTAYPWTEDFEAYAQGDFSAPCYINMPWQAGTGSGSTGKVFQVYTSSNGTNTTHQLQLPDQSKGTQTRLYLPEMQPDSTMRYFFDIDVYRTSASTFPKEGIRVLFVDENENETDLAFVPRDYSTAGGTMIPAESASGWYTYSLALPYSAKAYRIVLQGESDYGSSTYMDNLIVREVEAGCMPVQMDVLEIHMDSAVLYLDSIANDYMVVVAKNAAFTQGLDTVYVTNDTIAAIGNLEPATNYYVRCYVICGEGLYSDASNVVAFTTECGAIALPYAENFENMPLGSSSSDAPLCWDLIGANEGTYPYIYVNNSSSYAKGTKSLYFQSSNSKDGYAVLPELALPINQLRISFSCKFESTSSSGKLYVGYVDSTLTASSFVSLYEVTRSTSWQDVVVELTAASDNAARIALKYAAQSQNYYLGVDDIKVDVRPQDETLVDVTTANVDRRSFDIAWTPKSDTSCKDYDLVISKTALNDAALDTMEYIKPDTTIYHAAGLDRNTTYYIYVRTSCVAGSAAHGKWYSTSVKTNALIGCVEDQIGNGSSSAYLIYSSWGNTYSQHIYTAAELTAAGLSAGPISSLVFEFDNTAATDTKLQTIYMGHTAQSEFAGGTAADFIGNLDLVFAQREMTKENGWMTYVLDDAFEWDGTSNIVVGFLSNYNGSTGGGTSSGWSAKGVSGSNYRTIYRYRDNTPIDVNDLASVNNGSRSMTRPNIRFVHCYALPACPAVAEASVAAITSSSATVNWTASEADYLGSYEVVLSDTAIVDFSAVTPQFVGIDSLSLELTGLTEHTDYYVYVHAVCNAEGKDEGVSDWTMVSFQTKADCNALENVVATTTGKTSAVVNWSRSAQGDNYCYILSLSEIAVEELDAMAKTAEHLTDTFVVLSGLELDTTYYVYVANECGAGAYSPFEMASFHTSVSCVPVSNLHAATVAFNAVQLAWNRGLYGEENEWEVGIVGNAASVQTVVDSSAIIIGLNAETEYTFYVKAVCGEGESSLAQTLTLTTPVDPGDAVEIGGEGTTSATAYPSNAYFNYSTSEQIYTAEEIGNSGNILSVAFRVVDQNTATRDLKVYLKHVVESEFASSTGWIAVDDADLVFEGEYTFTPNDWNVIDIAGFEYNGSDNLLVVVDDNTGSYVTSGTQPTFATFTGVLNQNLYSNSDNTNVDPTNPGTTSGTLVKLKDQIRFAFESSSCPKVSKLQVSNITRTEAKVSWFPGGSETKWAVALADHELSNTELASVAVDTLDHVMTKAYTGLTPDMDYYFYIRSLCSATERGDWKIAHFVTLPTCEVPVGLELDSITAHTAKLKWNKLNALYTGSYTLAYGLADAFDLANAATYQTVAATDTFVTVSGLEALSIYKFAIRANCGPDDDSRWSKAISVMTDCDVVSSFPYVENFDNPNEWYTSGSYQYHYCWPVGGSSSSYYPHIQTNTATYRYAYSDTAALYIYTGSGSSNYSIVATPELEGDLDTLRLRFKMRACYQSISTGNVSSGYYSSTYAHAIKVGSVASLQNITINPLATFTLKNSFAYGDALNEANNYGWEEFELYLTGVTDPYLVFYSDFASSNYVWIDDITIEPLPACQRPVIVADSIAADYAKLSWQEGSDYWRGYLVEGIDTVATYDTIRVNSLVLNSIQGATTYKLYLQSVCGSDASDWAEYEFTTSCAVISTYPWLEDFSKVETGAIPNCWDNTEGTTTDPTYRFVGYNDNGNMCVRFNSYSNSNGKTNILVTPELAIVENMNFGFSYKNPTGGSLKVKVSYNDGATFTTLATLNRESTWNDLEYNFDQFAGKTVRVYFEATSNYGNGDAYIYLDNVMLNTFNPNCLGVENITVSNVGPHSADVEFQYIAGSRNALVEVSNRSDFSTVIFTETLTNDSVCHVTGLIASTTHYVRIKQLCGAGEESAYTVAHFTTALGVPYAPDFSVGIPADWSMYQYRVNDNVPQFATSNFTTTSSGWKKVNSNSAIASAHLKCNIYGTSAQYWAVSPAIDLSVDGDQGVMLGFDLALAKYNSSDLVTTNADQTGTDDRFMVVISEDGGLTWDLANATIWNNDASGLAKYRYYDVPKEGQHYTINLTNYVGKSIALGIYGESTVSNADNDMHIGNINIYNVPSTPVYDSICNGYDYAGYGFSVSYEDYHLGENLYSHVTPAIDSLHTDSITTLHLFVKPTAKYEFADTICHGESYFQHGFEIQSQSAHTGHYDIHVDGTNGCDSVVTLNLVVLPELKTEIDTLMCKGTPFEYGGKQYFNSQVIKDTLVSQQFGHFACDSIVTIYLEFSKTEREETSHRELICPGTKYADDLFTDSIAVSGTYTAQTTSIYGCDSLVTLRLIVAKDYGESNIYDTIYVDELPYVINGQELIPAGANVGLHSVGIMTECTYYFLRVRVIDRPVVGLEFILGDESKSVRKVMIDQHIYLIVGDEWYDTTGKHVEPVIK